MINVLDLAQIVWHFLLIRRVVRNLQWGAVYGSVGAKPPEAIGGLRAKPLAAGGTEVWGRSPQALKNIASFWQKQLNFRPILIKISATKTWHRS